MYTFPGKTTRCLRCFSHKKKNGDSHTAPPSPGASSVSRALRRLPQREWTRAFFKQRQTAEEKRKVRRQRPSFLKYGDKKPPPERPERTTTPPVAPGGGFARHHFDRRRSHRLRPGRSRENGRTEQAIRHTTGQRLRPRPTPPPAKKTVLKQSASGRSVASRIACE